VNRSTYLLLSLASLGVAIAILLSASSLLAQGTTTISPSATPPTFNVRLTGRVVLSDAASPVKDGAWRAWGPDSRKRYYATAGLDSKILVFDSAGKFLQNVGRRGKGPGEYMNLRRVFVGADDTLYAHDLIGNITVLDRDYKYVRRIPIGLMFAPLRLRNGRYANIVTGQTLDEINWNHRLEFVDGKGKRIKAIDIGPKRSTNPEEPSSRHWTLAESPDGGIWTAIGRTYFVDQWDVAGKQRVAFIRKIDDPDLKNLIKIPFNEPQVIEIQCDGSGLLWVMFALRTGRTHRARVRTDKGMRDMEVDEYKTILDVIDPKTGKLLASTSIAADWPTFVGERLLSRRIETDDGSAALEVLELSLVPARRTLR
jgi:hypothetical protein